MSDSKTTRCFDTSIAHPYSISVALIAVDASRGVALDRHSAETIPPDYKGNMTESAIAFFPDGKPSEGWFDPLAFDFFGIDRFACDEILSSGAPDLRFLNTRCDFKTETHESRAPRVARIQTDRSKKLSHFRPIIRSDLLNPKIDQRRIEMGRYEIMLR